MVNNRPTSGFFDDINHEDVKLLIEQINQQFAQFDLSDAKMQSITESVSAIYVKIELLCEKISLLPKEVAKLFYDEMNAIYEKLSHYQGLMTKEKESIKEAIEGINNSFNAAKAYTQVYE